jgi:hypothetical protein
MLYRYWLHLTWATLLMIDTIYSIGSLKSNYHMIMLTTTPRLLSTNRLILHIIKTAKPVKTKTSLEPALCSEYTGVQSILVKLTSVCVQNRQVFSHSNSEALFWQLIEYMLIVYKEVLWRSWQTQQCNAIWKDICAIQVSSRVMEVKFVIFDEIQKEHTTYLCFSSIYSFVDVVWVYKRCM